MTADAITEVGKTGYRARHRAAAYYVRESLFSGLGSFAELEARIAGLDSNRARGDAFEVFAEAYLATQKITQADEVWPGETLPLALAQRLRLPTTDMGVDGVYRTLDGAHRAYQVKFRSRRPALNWTELSTFMGLADQVDQRLLFTNCDDLPSVMNERRGFVCVRGSDLDRLTASDFAAIDAWLRGDAVAPTLKSPLPYQRDALDNIAKGLRTGNRATAVMACGSGKTLVALWAAQEMGVKRIIVLLPSLALVRQSLHEWLKETSWPRLRFITVCSDPTVTSGAEDNLRVEQSDLDFAVTTQAEDVRAFMDADFDCVRVVFSTYQSARVVGDAIGNGQGFDLGIFDEAHKTTGREGKGFSFALEDHNLPIAKRLFLTATPRHYDVRNRDKEGDRKLVYSMDVPETYGPIVHTLSFAEAARRGIVCHCKIIISVVTSDMVDGDLLKRGEVLVNGDVIRAGAVANQIALQKACEAHDLRKVFSFHANVASARDFTGEGSSSVREHMPAFETLHVSGAMPTAHRERVMQGFREAERAVISNARCLTEGVDVPAVDVVAFLSPRKSKVDIVQAAGRAIRNAPGKTVGYVLLPLFVETAAGESVEEALARTGFEEAWNVIGALAEQDDVLADIIRQMCEERGRRGGFDDSRLREIVEVIGPSVSLEALRDAVSAQIVDYVGVTWDERLGELAAYKAKYGDCRVPQRWPENPTFGSWVQTQRTAQKAGKLSADKVARLEALGFEWDPHAADWENSFAELEAYKARYGNCRVPQRWPENPSFAAWVNTQRSAQRAGKLSAHRTARLEALGFDWDPFAAEWEKSFAELETYKARYGNCRVPQRWPENPSFATWVSQQRSDQKAGKLSADKAARLEALGFDWDPLAADWESSFADLEAYRARFGNCRVPTAWPENPSFGWWVRTQRGHQKAGKLSADKAARLEALGFDWDPLAADWESSFADLEAYRARFGNCRVPNAWPENPSLGMWVGTQRSAQKAGKLSADKVARLGVLGFEWDLLAVEWENSFDDLEAYKARYGNCRVPQAWPESPSLGRWVSKQRVTQKAGKLSADKAARLEAMGFEWDLLAVEWENSFADLEAYKARHGNCKVPDAWPESPSLGRWVSKQRVAQKSGKLSADRAARLEVLGFERDPFAAVWENSFAELHAYKARHGNCKVPDAWQENQSLGGWVKRQRSAQKAGKLAADRIARLEALGFEWSVR